MPSVEHLRSLILDLPPSCIEFWPSNPEYAVAGTYNLEKQGNPPEPSDASVEEGRKIQQRNGSLILLQLHHGDVAIIQTLTTPSAILDIHFGPSGVPDTCFGVATSTGSIDIYELRKATSENRSIAHPDITHIKTIQYFPEDALVTSFSWHPKGTLIGMTLSSGQVCLGKVDLNNSLETTSAAVVTHDLEAWTLAFLQDGSGMYSGGDDSALRFTEIAENIEHYFNDTMGAEYGVTRRMSWADKKIHGAGVTAILPLHMDKEGILVLTGSYDDHIRLINISTAGRRNTLTELNLGGGVWRLKRLNASSTDETYLSKRPNDVIILASCMYAGARILKLSRDEDDGWQFEILAKFEEHRSMNYGSDSQPKINEKGQKTLITTSFYDRLLCLWRF